MEIQKQFHEIDAHVDSDWKVVENWSFKRLWNTAKEAAGNAWAKVKDTKDRAKKWANENPEMAALLVPVFGAALVGGINHMTLTEADKRAKFREEHEFYDSDVHVTYETTRAMTTAEKQYFAKRRRAGDSVDEILADMGILKLK